jgi:hypothetical protein
MMLKIVISFGAYLMVQLLWAKSALAWGPGVHTVTALSVLDDVQMLLPSVARTLTAFPLQFLYGCLSADFFIGKTKKTHTRHLHNWEGGFTLLRGAQEEREVAYAYGFLSHLAADVIAHNLFIPKLIRSFPVRSRMGHLYWEMKADYCVGPEYIRTAREVLAMDHQGCDGLLELAAGRAKNGLKAKKHVFTQSVKLSDYVCATHPMLFRSKWVDWKRFHEYFAFTLELSCRVVREFLKHPETSGCLVYDPMGRINLLKAKRRRVLMGTFNRRRPTKAFVVEPPRIGQ